VPSKRLCSLAYLDGLTGRVRLLGFAAFAPKNEHPSRLTVDSEVFAYLFNNPFFSFPMRSLFPVALLAIGLGHSSRLFAQRTLYLDAQVGGQYAYAEGAHFGVGQRPFKGNAFLITPFVAPMLRLQLSARTGVSVGYSGGGLGWGYRLQVPPALSNNPYGGVSASNAVSVYLDRVPLLVNRTIARFNYQEVDATHAVYRFGLGVDAFAGVGLNYVRGFCETCHLGAGFAAPGDTVSFRERPVIVHHWGGYVTAGVVGRVYHLGKERLAVTLFVNQGLVTMMEVPVQYAYNGSRGAVTLRVRGSGIGLLAAVPLRLKTFPARERAR